MSAVKKGRKSDPAQVKVEVVEHAGGVTLCAVYPAPDGRENTCAPGKGGRMNVRDNDVNVEFHVKVPAGVRFVGRTVNGGISGSGLTADAEAETVNGGVDLDSDRHGARQHGQRRHHGAPRPRRLGRHAQAHHRERRSS